MIQCRSVDVAKTGAARRHGSCHRNSNLLRSWQHGRHVPQSPMVVEFGSSGPCASACACCMQGRMLSQRSTMISVLFCSFVFVECPQLQLRAQTVRLPGRDSAAIRSSQLSQSFSARVLGSGRSPPSQRAGVPLRADVSKNLHFGLPQTFHSKALRLIYPCVDFFHHPQ